MPCRIRDTEETKVSVKVKRCGCSWGIFCLHNKGFSSHSSRSSGSSSSRSRSTTVYYVRDSSRKLTSSTAMDPWGDCPLCMHHGAYPLKSRYYRQSQLHEGPWGYQFQAQGGHFAHHDHVHDHHHEILHGHGGGIFPVRPSSLGYLPIETPFLVHVKDHPANARGTGRGYYYDVSLTRDLSATDIISFLTTNPTRFKVMFKNPQGDFEELTPDMDTRELLQHMTKFDIMLREHVHTTPVFAITPEHALSYPRALHP